MPLPHDRAAITGSEPHAAPAAPCPSRLHSSQPQEQMLLFAQEQPPTMARPAVNLMALHTNLETRELTVDQIGGGKPVICKLAAE
ncbi:hypothetical protein AB0K80_26775 [Streptomyces sp. NPDC052682]|uniref:hypothetical protein n=1 Tax=Streptomyces sp. NPDC052682 TaxID=3154954 RepID=UPI00341D370F